MIATLEVPAVQDKEVETLISDLRDVVDDMCERVRCKDPQFNSGVQTFRARYNGMLSNKYPTLSLASALHHFNCTAANYKRAGIVGSNRSGRRIHVQPTAAGRRRKSASRGNQAEICGRPAKLKRVSDKENNQSEANRYMLPARKKNQNRIKRKHALKLCIDAGTQNAGKW